MKNNIIDIILIFVISMLIGVGRALVLNDISIIKTPPLIVEKLPEFLSEPILIDLDLSKELFDSGAIFIDARDSILYSDGHIEGSLLIPWENTSNEDIDNILSKFNYNDVVVTYCSGGDCTLSLDIADYVFDELSFEKVFVFEGGYPLWVEKGFPIKKYCKIENQHEKNAECIYVK